MPTTDTRYKMHRKVSVWVTMEIEADSLDDAVLKVLSGDLEGGYDYVYDTMDDTEFPRETFVETIVGDDVSEVNAREHALEHNLDIHKCAACSGGIKVGQAYTVKSNKSTLDLDTVHKDADNCGQSHPEPAAQRA